MSGEKKGKKRVKKVAVAEGEIFLDQVNKEKNMNNENVNDDGAAEAAGEDVAGAGAAVAAGVAPAVWAEGVLAKKAAGGDGVDVGDGVDGVAGVGVAIDAGAAPVGRRLGVLASIAVGDLFPHPENRDEDHGLEFQELCASVRELGILQPLIVRWKSDPAEGEWYEILAGHRRCRAAVACGLTHVPCVELRECSDDDALAVLVVENFERKNLDLVEEAEAMEVAMRVLEWDVNTVARKFSRQPGYIQLSLRLLDLDGPARKLVKSGGVKRETIVAVLALENAEERERAVQLCFWPGGSSEPLNGHQARQMISAAIVRPREEARKWDESAVKVEKKIKKGWREKTAVLHSAEMAGLVEGLSFDVRVPGYDEAMRFVEEVRTWTRADEVVPASMLMPARSGVRWWMIAAMHGLPGYYLPVDGVGQADVYVNRHLLIAGETARFEKGMGTFLAFGKKSVECEVSSDPCEEAGGGEADDEKSDAPPERRTVTRDSGRTVTVSRDRLERVRDLFAAISERPLTADECLELPSVIAAAELTDHEVLAHKIITAKVVLDWVLDGCPAVGSV